MDYADPDTQRRWLTGLERCKQRTDAKWRQFLPAGMEWKRIEHHRPRWLANILSGYVKTRRLGWITTKTEPGVLWIKWVRQS